MKIFHGISDRPKEEYYIESLKTTLQKYGLPESYFSFDGFVDECLCLEKENNRWTVYVGERGQKIKLKQFDSISTACKAFIDQAAEPKNRNKMQKDFSKIIAAFTAPPTNKTTFVGQKLLPNFNLKKANNNHKEYDKAVLRWLSEIKKQASFQKIHVGDTIRVYYTVKAKQEERPTVFEGTVTSKMKMNNVQGFVARCKNGNISVEKAFSTNDLRISKIETIRRARYQIATPNKASHKKNGQRIIIIPKDKEKE